MRFPILCCVLSLTLTSLAVAAESSGEKAKDTRLFEMRTYYAAPGKLDALSSRFRNHTCKLFAKHGMVNVGYWIPSENPDNKLTYILAYPDREARENAWKAFGADPEWKAVAAESEKNGRLVTKVDSLFLKATDFSPAIAPSSAAEPRVFELRVYKCTSGNLPNLLARFRDHTVALFKKHGMTNIGYWTPVEKANGADDTLVYILAHKSREAAAESFKNFGADPEWIAARKASEEKAGGPLTIPNGVKSTFMTPTDYSPMK
ncbi:MAG: NIPSNAP family protein [Bacillota bacterium]